MFHFPGLPSDSVLSKCNYILSKEIIEIYNHFHILDREKNENFYFSDAAEEQVNHWRSHIERPLDRLSENDRDFEYTSRRLSSYLDFTRFRYKLDSQFRVYSSKDDYDAFLKWYLIVYTQIRKGYRVPLGRIEIEYLNSSYEPSFITKTMNLLREEMRCRNLTVDDSKVDKFVYDWVINMAPKILVEDRLVTKEQKDLLASVSKTVYSRFPLTVYLDFEIQEIDDASFDSASEITRFLLYIISLFKSIRNPDIIDFIDRSEAVKILKWMSLDDWNNLRMLMMQVFFCEPTDIVISRLKNILERFESKSVSSTNEQASKVIKNETAFDIQVIGPVSRASGLGEATRLSIKLSSLRVSSCPLL